jgi:hypothetical protein
MAKGKLPLATRAARKAGGTRLRALSLRLIFSRYLWDEVLALHPACETREGLIT